MSTQQAHTGMGAVLSKGDGNSPENFIPVLGVKSIQGPGIKRDTHDTTDMNASSVFRAFIGGLVDAGEVTFDCNWLPREATQNQSDGGLMAEFDKGSCASLSHWRIHIPDCPGEPSMFMAFDGIFSGQDNQIPMDDLMSFSGTIKVSGRPELTVET